MATSNRKALAEKLIGIIGKEAEKVPDYRPDNDHDKISLHDAIMCGLAVMHLKYPSLLQFDRDCRKENPDKCHNLKSLYGVEKVPSDTHIRALIDPIETRYFRKFFVTAHILLARFISPLLQPSKTVAKNSEDGVLPIKYEQLQFFTKLFSYVQRSGRLQQFEYFDEGYLAPIDGTGHFSSGIINCAECCVKKPDSKNPQYYHQLLGCSLVKPGKKEVLPLMPEPIIQQVDASKNDCEKTALKRLLANISREHPHLKLGALSV